MAKNNSENRKKKIFYAVVLIVVIIALLFFAYQYFIVPKGGFYNFLFPPMEEEIGQKPKLEVEFETDFPIKLESLRSYGDIPVEVGQTGRSNPFQVY